MKKLLFLGLVLGGFAVTSCSKEYNCECNGTNTYSSNWEKGDLGFEAAKTTCNSLSDCEWKEQ